jgi:hypothetical protein
MKSFSFSLIACTAAVLVTGSLCARADSKPNFEDDAKPILSQQPGLVEFVESKFQVKDTGIAKYPGDDDHAPVPPYIFRARERGSNGPFNLRLLIQPGPPGHILGIVKDSAPQQPAVAQASAPSHPPVQTPQVQAPAEQPPALTSDTPSGPVGVTSAPAPATPTSNAPNLAPPPDPAPQTH